MSKASKLARMKNTVLETTGLTYKPSGGDVQLNFFPDSTNSGVSVPLVLAGNTNIGICAAINLHPLTGYPYAHIRNSKPGSTSQGGGDFYQYSDTAVSRPSMKIDTMYWRSRLFTERVTDEIGIDFTQVSSGISGGPGTLLNFPTGTYKINGTFPVYASNRNTIALYNQTVGQNTTSGIVLAGPGQYISSSSVTINKIVGRFTVSDNSDNYCIVMLAQSSQPTLGFGVQSQVGGYVPQTDAVYEEMEIWKIS